MHTFHFAHSLLSPKVQLIVIFTKFMDIQTQTSKRAELNTEIPVARHSQRVVQSKVRLQMRMRLHWQNLSYLDGRKPEVKDYRQFHSLWGSQISIRKEYQRQEALTKMCKGWLLAFYMFLILKANTFCFCLFNFSLGFICRSSEFLKELQNRQFHSPGGWSSLTLLLLRFCFHSSHICRGNLLLRLNTKKDLSFYRCTVVYKQKCKYQVNREDASSTMFAPYATCGFKRLLSFTKTGYCNCLLQPLEHVNKQQLCYCTVYSLIYMTQQLGRKICYGNTLQQLKRNSHYS